MYITSHPSGEVVVEPGDQIPGAPDPLLISNRLGRAISLATVHCLAGLFNLRQDGLVGHGRFGVDHGCLGLEVDVEGRDA